MSLNDHLHCWEFRILGSQLKCVSAASNWGITGPAYAVFYLMRLWSFFLLFICSTKLNLCMFIFNTYGRFCGNILIAIAHMKELTFFNSKCIMFWKEGEIREKTACKFTANCLILPVCLNSSASALSTPVSFGSHHLKLAGPFSFHSHCRPNLLAFASASESGDVLYSTSLSTRSSVVVHPQQL